jgi:N-acetylglucosaminyl-diphospho-decaprenol L-rhamnosyltransferase
MVGPQIVDLAGERYPSVRRFPSMLDAAGHALLGSWWKSNPFSARYRSAGNRSDGGVDWVSGACFAIRRNVFEELGGFDESFFMFAEDLDICWRCHEAGYNVGYDASATVLHHEGATRKNKRYAMILAHHRSAFRFQVKTTKHARFLLLPLAAAVLGLRLGVALLRELLRSS